MKTDLVKALAAKTSLLKTAPTGQKYVDDMDGLEHFADLLVQKVLDSIEDERFTVADSVIESVKKRLGVETVEDEE